MPTRKGEKPAEGASSEPTLEALEQQFRELKERLDAIAPDESPKIVVHPYFKWAFTGVVSFWALSFVGLVIAAIWGGDPPTPAQQSLAKVCEYIMAGGAGALFGLLAGKTSVGNTP